MGIRFMSSEKAPWLWFDVDDVLVDSAPVFQASMDRWSGITVPWETWHHNHFHQFYGVRDDDQDTIARMKQVWRDDQVLERSPLRPGVADTLKHLHDQGFSLGLLTARAWHPDGVAITQAMVDGHQLPVNQIISMEYAATKADFLKASGTRVVGFVDDTIRHIEGCVAAGINAVLMAQPWNTQATHLDRVPQIDDYPRWLRSNLSAADQPSAPARARRRPSPG